jgi:hypothetical protein
LAVLDSLSTVVVAQATTTTTTAPPGPVVEFRGPGAAVLVVGIGVVLALIWFVPIWVDARRAYRLRERAIELVGGRLLDAAKKDGLKVSELRELLATIGEPATGQRGLARALMAFTIITVVGVALAALLLSSAGDASDLRKTVVTSLLTLLGTIVGFYFGTRAAEGAGERPEAPAQPAPAPPAGEEVPPAAGEGTAESAGAGAAPAAAEEAPAVVEEETPAGAEEPAAEEVADDEVTPSEGPTELDQEGNLQPVADAEEDDDPLALAGEEPPDEKDAR